MLVQARHQSDRFHRTQNVISDVYFPPENALASRALEAVVVVVPAFAQGDQCKSQIVSARVACVKPLAAEDMPDRVDAAGPVKENNRTDEESPDEKL